MDDTDRRGATALIPRQAPDEAGGLRRLAEVVAGAAELQTALRDVNRLVAAPVGIDLVACVLVSPTLRAATGAGAPSEAEARAVDRWRAAFRHGSAAEPVGDLAGVDGALVPVVHRRRVHGALRVVTADVARGAVDAPDDEALRLLPALGLAIGEVVWKAGMRRELARSRRRIAIAVEQERTARDVQALVHRRMAVMGDRLAAHIAQAPDRVWRERMEELLLLTGEVDRDVRQSLNFLRTLPVQRDDLPASLRALVREVAAETTLSVKVFVHGEPRRLSTGRVEALFHAAVEAVLAASFDARAGNAVVVLEFRPGDVRLVVRDDGVGLVHRNLFGAPGTTGVRGIQERLARLGGRLRVLPLRPRGAEIEAVVPTRRKRNAGRG